MSMYTTAQLLAANEQKFKFDPLFLRLFFREMWGGDRFCTVKNLGKNAGKADE